MPRFSTIGLGSGKKLTHFVNSERSTLKIPSNFKKRTYGRTKKKPL